MLRPLLTALCSPLRSRSDLVLENLALRQQLAVLQGRRPRRRMSASGRLFWVALLRLWPKWSQVLLVVKPETVVRWHRLGFRAFWRWRSRPQRPGRPKVDPKLRALIQRMARENPWGAPRIHRTAAARIRRRGAHLALDKNAPNGRLVERPPRVEAEIVAFPRVGGLHHRYAWRSAA